MEHLLVDLADTHSSAEGRLVKDAKITNYYQLD